MRNLIILYYELKYPLLNSNKSSRSYSPCLTTITTITTMQTITMQIITILLHPSAERTADLNRRDIIKTLKNYRFRYFSPTITGKTPPDCAKKSRYAYHILILFQMSSDHNMFICMCFLISIY